jgi:hypothetical protein
MSSLPRRCNGDLIRAQAKFRLTCENLSATPGAQPGLRHSRVCRRRSAGRWMVAPRSAEGVRRACALPWARLRAVEIAFLCFGFRPGRGDALAQHAVEVGVELRAAAEEAECGGVGEGEIVVGRPNVGRRRPNAGSGMSRRGRSRAGVSRTATNAEALRPRPVHKRSKGESRCGERHGIEEAHDDRDEQ